MADQHRRYGRAMVRRGWPGAIRQETRGADVGAREAGVAGRDGAVDDCDHSPGLAGVRGGALETNQAGGRAVRACALAGALSVQIVQVQDCVRRDAVGYARGGLLVYSGRNDGAGDAGADRFEQFFGTEGESSLGEFGLLRRGKTGLREDDDLSADKFAIASCRCAGDAPGQRGPCAGSAGGAAARSADADTQAYTAYADFGAYTRSDACARAGTRPSAGSCIGANIRTRGATDVCPGASAHISAYTAANVGPDALSGG
jgi:hypothetical protein